MKKTFIVLGHTGFIGRRIFQILQERKDGEVHGLSRAALDLLRAENFKVLDPLMGPQTTLILSSALTPEHCKTVDAYMENVIMGANMARYLESHPLGKMVVVSTEGVTPMIDVPVTEETHLDPVNLYVLSKLAAERSIEIVAKSKNIPLVIPRPTGVYGWGDPHNSYGPNRFVRTIVADRKVDFFGEGEELRDHVYIEDVAQLIVRMAEGDATGIFNIASGRSVTFANVVGILKELAPFPFTVNARPRSGPLTHRHFDVSRIRKTFPDFKFTELRDGLAKLMEAALKAPQPV